MLPKCECGRDQVPGRTITESELSQKLANVPPYADEAVWLRAVLNALGVTVVPDPEPTNAEKWAKFLRKVNPTSVMIDDYAKAIDAAGVKAPGGDDGQ